MGFQLTATSTQHFMSFQLTAKSVYHAYVFKSAGQQLHQHIMGFQLTASLPQNLMVWKLRLSISRYPLISAAPKSPKSPVCGLYQLYPSFEWLNHNVCRIDYIGQSQVHTFVASITTCCGEVPNCSGFTAFRDHLPQRCSLLTWTMHLSVFLGLIYNAGPPQIAKLGL